MRLLIDNNILLDVLQKRCPHYENSRRIWAECVETRNNGYISALTFADIVYIMRKEVAYNEIDALLATITKFFSVVDLTLFDLDKAANMKWRDFEDAVQSSTAERINADYIITRNTKDFESSKVKDITPEEYFEDVFTID